MKHTPVAAAVALAPAGAAAAPAPPQLRNPPLGYTGGFEEPTCVQCHIGNDVNAFGGTVRVEGLPDRYVPGERYALTVALRAEETTVAGFQLAARYAHGPNEGLGAGSLDAIRGISLVSDTLGVTYAHHAESGAVAPNRSGAIWSLFWTAPEDATPVVLHVAANSGNGDESPLGDLVFTHAVVVEPDS